MNDAIATLNDDCADLIEDHPRARILFCVADGDEVSEVLIHAERASANDIAAAAHGLLAWARDVMADWQCQCEGCKALREGLALAHEAIQTKVALTPKGPLH